MYKEVIVNIVNDEWVELPEQFIVQLIPSSIAAIDPIDTALVTIMDDDSKYWLINNIVIF